MNNMNNIEIVDESNTKRLYIFTDASSNEKITVGTYIFLEHLNISHSIVDNLNIENLTYDTLSSTIGEMKIINDVMDIMIKRYSDLKDRDIYLYTDCKNFINLCEIRRYKPILKKHRNYEFYENLLDKVDKYKIKPIWTKGHDKIENKTTLCQKIFSKVDKTARKILRCN